MPTGVALWELISKTGGVTLVGLFGRIVGKEASWQLPRTDMYTLPCVKQAASGKLVCNTETSAHCSGMTSRGGDGGREVQEGRDICIHVADSLLCTVENNAALYRSCTP